MRNRMAEVIKKWCVMGEMLQGTKLETQVGDREDLK